MTASKSVVASVLARLRNIAAAGGLSFNDVLQNYVNERFLARLARLPDADSVLLKGALMLKVWGVPRARPTMDIDLLRRGDADQKSLRQFVERCAGISDPADGVLFDSSTIVLEPIRADTEYVGVRIRLQARLDKVRLAIQIDFGIGDAVHPRPQAVEFPLLLGGPPVRLHAYPVEATIAEKFQAMIDLDMLNSRMKDFYDIWLLSQTLNFDGEPLSAALRATFERRQTPLPMEIPVALSKRFYGDPGHVRQWSAFVRRINEPALVNDFERIVTEIVEFVMPPSIGAAAADGFAARWSPKGPWLKVK